MRMILTFNHTVAELSIWLAVFTRISNWTAVLEENTRPLSPSSNFHRVVERDTNRTAQSLRTGL